MSRIQALPDEVVHLIAAGEVIDSPAAVVRELVENALDAGATRLTVSLWPEQWRIRVSDNGSGIDLDNLKQAASPHSTSKIRDRDDLWRITSLGFRGEALHSLAQLADLEICSRCEGEAGWQVIYDHHGNPDRIETVAIAPGTVVTVGNLFAPWPARREGLPSIPQQIRAVQTLIQQTALCHPHLTWQAELRDRPWLSLWPSESPRQILPQVVRGIQPTDLQEIEVDLPAPDAEQPNAGPKPTQANRLHLTLGLPDRCHRRRPDWVKVALNGRLVQAPELEQAIFNAFRRTLPRDRHPVCFLHLWLSPDHIDWNRHPAKTEIYLHHVSYWQAQVAQAIETIFRLNTENLGESSYSQRIGQVLKAAEAEGAYATSRTVQPLSPDLQGSTNSATAPAPHGLRAIAQVHNMYILAEHPSGMWLIEQHIAHERVLYEQLCDRWHLVALEPPLILHQLTPAQVEQLQRIGLDIEVFGEQLWAIRNAPEPLARREDCGDALLELSLGGNLDTALVATACRTAIRNGTPLNPGEMKALIDQWQQTRNPHTCPHGRPIYLSLEESSLARFFRRHWVIGKSHGI